MTDKKIAKPESTSHLGDIGGRISTSPSLHLVIFIIADQIGLSLAHNCISGLEYGKFGNKSFPLVNPNPMVFGGIK